MDAMKDFCHKWPQWRSHCGTINLLNNFLLNWDNWSFLPSSNIDYTIARFVTDKNSLSINQFLAKLQMKAKFVSCYSSRIKDKQILSHGNSSTWVLLKEVDINRKGFKRNIVSEQTCMYINTPSEPQVMVYNPILG